MKQYIVVKVASQNLYTDFQRSQLKKLKLLLDVAIVSGSADFSPTRFIFYSLSQL